MVMYYPKQQPYSSSAGKMFQTYFICQRRCVEHCAMATTALISHSGLDPKKRSGGFKLMLVATRTSKCVVAYTTMPKYRVAPARPNGTRHVD